MIGDSRKPYHRAIFSATLRDERERRGMSQERLAELLSDGAGRDVDRRQVVRLEHGEVSPTLEVIEAVAEALGVPTFAFLFSALPLADPAAPAEYVEAMERWMDREVRVRFQAAAERPQLVELVKEAVALPEGELGSVIEITRAFRRAQFAPPDTAQASPVDAIFTPLSRSLARKSRRRKDGKGPATVKESAP